MILAVLLGAVITSNCFVAFRWCRQLFFVDVQPRLLTENLRTNGMLEILRASRTLEKKGDSPYSPGKNNEDPSLRETKKRHNYELAKRFYECHLERVTSLVNASTALVWDTTTPQKKFRTFLDAFPDLYTVPRGDKNFQLNLQAESGGGHKYIHWVNICQAAQAFRRYRQNATSTSIPMPHVLILALDENWGSFSASIPNKTASWSRGLEHKWNKAGCSVDDIAVYLDHPNTRAVITTQFQAYDHPKVHSIPLGIHTKDQLKHILQSLQETRASTSNSNSKQIVPKGDRPHQKEETESVAIQNEEQFKTNDSLTIRPQLLMVNCQQHGMREASISKVIRNFNGTVTNTFQNKGSHSYKTYLAELGHSKFVLSPGGMGLDCYRHWEALLMGAIPVLEHLNRTDGWYRTFSNLPVAWIDSYDNLTPQFLEQEYERIIQQASTFRYEKLTKRYWIQMIQRQV